MRSMGGCVAVRPYTAADREAVRRLCLQTSWGGKSGEPHLIDPQLVVDFLTAYYTDHEPDACWVAEEPHSGRIVGYLLGCVRPDRYRRHRWRTAPRMAVRLMVAVARLAGQWLRGVGDRGELAARTRWLWWLVSRAWRELPPVPPRCAHLHFNVERAWRGSGVGQQLIGCFMSRVQQEVACGRLVGIYGQMALGPERRRAELFARLGWRVYATRPFTKYGPARGRVMATLFKPMAGAESPGDAMLRSPAPSVQPTIPTVTRV